MVGQTIEYLMLIAGLGLDYCHGFHSMRLYVNGGALLEYANIGISRGIASLHILGWSLLCRSSSRTT